MNQYEAMYVIDTTLDDEARTAVINRFSNLVEVNGGKVDRVDEWGKRRLAYAIDYKTEGYYVLMYITAPAALPRELERNFQINEAVLRSLVIRFEGALPPKREPLKPYTRPEAPVAEEPKPAAEEAPAEQPAAEEAPVEEAPAEQPAEEAAPAEPEAPAEQE